MKTLSYTIRTATPADYGRLAPIVSLLGSMPVTAENILEADTKVAGTISRRFMAEIGDEVVGYSRAYRIPSHHEGLFALSVSVPASQRHQGLGSLLLEAAEAFAIENGGTLATAEIRDDLPEGARFADKRGYVEHRRSFESALDLSNYDTQPLASAVEAVTATGIRFESYDQTDGSESAQRRLHEVNSTTARDNPGNDQMTEWPFEDFRDAIFSAHWFRPEGQILAFDGDYTVGLGAVGEMSPGSFYNCFTGVRREYRGRGIATALKILTIEVAKRLGGREIVTHNDSTNAAMIAINRKLGYTPRPGYVRLQKKLIQEEESR